MQRALSYTFLRIYSSLIHRLPNHSKYVTEPQHSFFIWTRSTAVFIRMLVLYWATASFIAFFPACTQRIVVNFCTLKCSRYPHIMWGSKVRVSSWMSSKAQLTLTNPCATRKHAENCSNSTWKQVAECRQVNDLFEVMQQPSAPTGEWYWRILLENSVFSPPRTCLTPHSGWTPCDINVAYTSLKSTFNGLQYGSIVIRLAVIASETREMSRNSLQQCKVNQGHRSWCQWKVHMWLPISH